MVSFESKPYSKRLLQLVSWSHWFTFFNIIAAILLSSIYVFNEAMPETLLGQTYLVTTWLSHMAFLTFMSFVLILFPLTLVWPNTRVIRTSGSIIFTFGLLLLILDGFIYSRLGYHLNASSRSQIIELIKEIAQNNGVFYIVSGALTIIILGFEFTVSNYAWKHLKQLQKTIFARFVIITIVLAFFFSHLTHIWADANLDYDVLRQDTVLPLSYPATAKTLLTKYGLFDIDDYIERTTSPLSFSRAIPNYPQLTPQQCVTTNTINQSVFLILTDEQLNERQLKQLERRISVASYQLNNHVDTTLPNDTWFNLFYSLPNIYQQDILAQQTKPLLFQTIDQQNLASSYTLISKTINDSENLWFNELFDEKIQLNDISSLVFANKLNNKKPGLHLIYFKSSPQKNEQNSNLSDEINSSSRYQFELFVDALLLAQQQKTNKDIIWISSLGNQNKDTRLAVKPALLIAPNKRNNKTTTVSQLTSHMDLQPTLMANWLGCHIDSKSYSNGVNLLTLNKDRIIANTSAEGLMIFNKDKSVFIDQNGNFESYSSQLAAPITVNKDFPLMIDGVHFIKQFSQQAEQLK
jgi:membrane-anchored protein YejM (alkaline phosphatase superfamily)